MITIDIAGETRNLQEADERWIDRQINKRHADHLPVCVIVTIKEGDIDLYLQSGECPQGVGGGGRRPNKSEGAIFELWQKKGLNEPGYTGGHLIGFLKELRRLLP